MRVNYLIINSYKSAISYIAYACIESLLKLAQALDGKCHIKQLKAGKSH